MKTSASAADKRRMKINWPLLLGCLFVGIMLFLAIYGPRLAPHDPMQENYTLKVDGAIRTPPYPAFRVDGYPLGTDRYGRDLLSRILWGVRPTMLMVVSVALTRLALGIVIGLAAGWSRGRVGRALESLVSLLLSIPALIVALVCIYIVGIERGLLAFIVGLGLAGWAETARMVGEQTRSLQSQTFVEAARALGASDRHILGRHILRHILSLVWMLLAFEISAALLVSAELGFLGYYIGGGIWVEISDFVVVNVEGLPELGQMISSALVKITDPTALLVVGSVVSLGVLGFNLLGEGLRLRMSGEWMQGGRRFHMLTVGAEAWLEERVLQPLSFWLEEHRSRLAWLLTALTLAVGAYFAYNAFAVKRLISDSQTVDALGAHLWASERYDAFGTLSAPVSLDSAPRLLWSAPVPGGPSGGPAVDADGVIYVAGLEKALLAFDPTGALLWQAALEEIPVGAPALDVDGRIFVADARGGVTAVDPDGTVLWRALVSEGREATSGPIVDAQGNIFLTVTDSVAALSPQGERMWYRFAADTYLQEPPRLSPDQKRIYLRNTAIEISSGDRLAIPIRPPEALLFADPSFFSGGNGLDYYRPGHEIVGWRYKGDALVTDPPITWKHEGLVLLLPFDQGVTRNGLAWLFYTTTWTDGRMIWLDAQSRLLGNYRFPRPNSRLIAIGAKDEAYICGANTATVECISVAPGVDEPVWRIMLATPGKVAGGALIPGRFLLAVGGDGLYVYGAEAGQ